MAARRRHPRHGRRPQMSKNGTLTPVACVLRNNAPSPSEVLDAMDCLATLAAYMEHCPAYLTENLKGSLSYAGRLDLVRDVLVIATKNASADLVWDIVEDMLLPAIVGLCQGRREVGNIIGTGMIGSDGRDHLRDLDRDEGEPLSRIVAAIARHFPQALYGHPESKND